MTYQPGVQCNHIELHTRRCALDYGHAGPHYFSAPVQLVSHEVSQRNNGEKMENLNENIAKAAVMVQSEPNGAHRDMLSKVLQLITIILTGTLAGLEASSHGTSGTQTDTSSTSK